jgi:hypothetical protein
VRVRFRPATPGAKTASLQVSSADLAAPATSALTGTGGPVVPVTVAPSAFAFGSVAIGGRSPAQKLTVKNTGVSAVRVAGVLPTGDDAVQFPLDSSTCTGAERAPGDFCSVKVRCAPVGAAGPRAAAERQQRRRRV